MSVEPRTSFDAGAIGSRVRDARTRRGRSLRSVAREIGVSPPTLTNLERGRSEFTISRLAAVAACLGLRPAELLQPDRVGAPRPFRDATGTGARGDGPLANAWMPASEDWRHYDPLGFDHVLAAALDEFLEHGYAGATLRAIAVRSDISVSAVRARYATKQKMLVAILDVTMTDLLSRSRAARAEGGDAVERFARLVECLALYHTHRRELGFIGASEMRSLKSPARDRVANLRLQQQRMVDEETEAAIASGRFRTKHAREAARAVVTMCTALPQWYDPAGPMSAEWIAEQYIEYALAIVDHQPHY